MPEQDQSASAVPASSPNPPPPPAAPSQAPTTSDKWHQGLSGVGGLICVLAAIWCHVFNRDDLAAGFTASGAALVGYCGGHLKGSQPDGPDPKL